MPSIKAVRSTKELVDSSKFNQYKEEELTDSFKGKVVVFKPEESEVAKNLKINKKGEYAIKLG